MNLLAAAFIATPAADPRFHRECLSSFISKYLDAMLSRNPGLLPRSADAQPLAIEHADCIGLRRLFDRGNNALRNPMQSWHTRDRARE